MASVDLSACKGSFSAGHANQSGFFEGSGADSLRTPRWFQIVGVPK